MTPPQGMSAKQEADVLVDSFCTIADLNLTRNQYDALSSSIEFGFVNREAAARADERVKAWKERGEADVRIVERWPLSVENMNKVAAWGVAVRPAQAALSHAVAAVCQVALPKVIRGIALPEAQPVERTKEEKI